MGGLICATAKKLNSTICGILAHNAANTETCKCLKNERELLVQGVTRTVVYANNSDVETG